MNLFIGCDAPPAIERGEFPLPKDVEIVEDIEIGHYGGMFILTETTQPTTFNLYVPNNLATSNILGRIFNTLVDYNPIQEEIVPSLAKSWDVAEDQKTYTFHLREGIQWSDGTPFTADDVIFTFDLILSDKADPETGATKPLYPTRYYSQLIYDEEKLEYKKIDTYTVQFRTPKVHAPFLYDMMSLAILPKHKLEKAHAEENFFKTWTTQTAINTPEELVGTGPFMLESFTPGERLILKPNPHYWRADSTGQRLPYLNRLIYKFVSESNTMIVYFATGQSSVSGIGPSDISWVRDMEETYDFSIYEMGPSTSISMIWFNLNPGKSDKGQYYVPLKKQKWFQDKHFRQAMYYAFNREAVIDAVFFGRGKPLDSMIPEARGKWHNPEVTKYRYNPEKSLELLKKAGFAQGKDGRMRDAEGNLVEFNLMIPSGSSSWEELVLTFKENLDEIGVTVNIETIDFATMIRRMDYTFDYEAGIIGWGSSSGAYDPSGSKALYLSEGIYHLWHPRQEKPATEWEARIDKLYREQEQTLDMEKRIANMHEIQAILADEVPMLFLASVEVYAGIQNKWRNIKIPPAGTPIWNLDEIWTPEPKTD